MGRETGLVFFVSALVILAAGLIMVSSKRVTRRYLIYRIVPLAGFFGAFGLAGLSDLPGGTVGQAAIAAAQTFVIMLILHVAVGRHLRS